MRMRDAIIHCDGSPDSLHSLARDLSHDVNDLSENVLKYVMVGPCKLDLGLKESTPASNFDTVDKDITVLSM